MPKTILPYVWFGGKRAVADLVWQRFGDIGYYVEPFFGGGAVYLLRPSWHRRAHELINDVNGFVVNFWRAIKWNPDGILDYVDWMINDLDKHAKQEWLANQYEALKDRLIADPHYYDCKIAGWWAWGINAHVGSGWCERPLARSRCELGRRGINWLTDRTELSNYLHSLSQRLRNAIVTCLDWHKAISLAATLNNWDRFTIGLFLDPPYRQNMRDDRIYMEDDASISDACRQFCTEHSNSKMRIALCGFEGEHNELERYGWAKIEWMARGGYNNQAKQQDGNSRHNERIWFSPSCGVDTKIKTLFEED